MRTIHTVVAAVLLALTMCSVWGAEEDGYQLWMRYRPLTGAARAEVSARASSLVVPGPASPTTLAAVGELNRALTSMLGSAPLLRSGVDGVADGALVLATPASWPEVAAYHLPLGTLGAEGYVVRSTKLRGHPVTLIVANTDIGLLYGSFAWLRAVQTLAPGLGLLDITSAPKLQLRMLNHWDNLDRTVERGYAGESLWDWWNLPDVIDPRYQDYARANASLGINGVALNNVNAKAEVLTAPWIAKAAALAQVFRPYGIKVFLAVRFSSPMEQGATATADPLNPQVRAWWAAKADEIYQAIPDFGGFLVKANSEGQPGPQDYGRSHADGANMLAQALAPHQGLVMWRAFVYSPESSADRAAQAYAEFKPLDGKFASNVIVQVKNGPIDFQPREAFHPLFGAMPHTPLAIEFQITKEYLGFASHLAYLGPLYEEVLQTDTQIQGAGSTVARIVEGSLYGNALAPPRHSAMVGVANVGSHRTWSGSHFDQANWYVFGRMAWDPQAKADAVARDWIAQTWTRDARAGKAILAMMMGSREAVVDYMTPLGLHHLMDTGHHYGPGPWVDNLGRADWNPTYYHRADKNGIGFDRGSRGSNAIAQYAPALARQWADPRTTPDKLLLWFHHLPWDYRMPSGRTLWNELVLHYDSGVAAAVQLQADWAGLKADIDPRRHAEVASLLSVQVREAQWWRDACVAYFQSISGLSLPNGSAPPPLSLNKYKERRFPFAPGRG